MKRFSIVILLLLVMYIIYEPLPNYKEYQRADIKKIQSGDINIAIYRWYLDNSLIRFLVIDNSIIDFDIEDSNQLQGNRPYWEYKEGKVVEYRWDYVPDNGKIIGDPFSHSGGEKNLKVKVPFLRRKIVELYLFFGRYPKEL